MQRNVKAQQEYPNSILNYYKKLIALRQSWSSLRRGKLTLLGEDSSVLAYLRERQDNPIEGQDNPILVLLNMSEEKSLFRGESFAPLTQKTWKVLASTHSIATENFPSLRVNLKPFEGLMLKSD